MISLKRISPNYILAIDPNTDCSYLLPTDKELVAQNALLTFDSSAVCVDAQNKTVCRLKTVNDEWVSENDLGITTKPVSFNKVEGIFDVEAEFCAKWLELNLINNKNKTHKP